MDLFDPKPMLDKHHGKPYFDKIAGEVENIERCRRADAQPVQVRRSTASAAMWVSDAHAAPRRHRGRHRPHPLDVHHQPDARAGDLPDPVRQDGAGPAVARLVGGLRPGHARTRTCRPTSCSTIRWDCRSTASRTGKPGFLPPVFQGTRFRSTGSPVLNLQARCESARRDRPNASATC